MRFDNATRFSVGGKPSRSDSSSRRLVPPDFGIGPYCDENPDDLSVTTIQMPYKPTQGDPARADKQGSETFLTDRR